MSEVLFTVNIIKYYNMKSKTKIVFSFQLPKSLQEPFQVWDSIVWQQSECERVSDEKLNYERCQVSQGGESGVC